MQEHSDFEEPVLASESISRVGTKSEKGQIYTRPNVVQFMLSAIGLKNSDDFQNACILEPSCGQGEFALAIVERMINATETLPPAKKIADKLLAIDIDHENIEIAKVSVRKLLKNKGYRENDAAFLAQKWFWKTDFLLEKIEPGFSHVIGNPPYVRVENIPKELLDKYRSSFPTMTDRADLYIPFFEKGLSLLKGNGRLSFICTDRWTKNKYGKLLRKKIDEHYSLELFVDLHGVSAFESGVMTYPAITQISGEKCKKTVLKYGSDFSEKEASEVVSAIEGKTTHLETRKDIVDGENPWLFGASEEIAVIREIEKRFPLLEDVGCKVYIGAATGANDIFIVDKDQLDLEIEEDRLLPVITAKELKSGSISWRGKYLINTYDENGIINLDDYPNLSRYLNTKKDRLSRRHVAKNDKNNWFKTIDRVYANRARSEKLLIPDISSNPVVVHDSGRYHPNNSVYYVCSEQWDLHALRVVLKSNITKMFISSYSTKIAKGYLRFQAQHLRKLRLPMWHDVKTNLKKRLIEAGKNDHKSEFNNLACELYQLADEYSSIVGE